MYIWNSGLFAVISPASSISKWPSHRYAYCRPLLPRGLQLDNSLFYQNISVQMPKAKRAMGAQPAGPPAVKRGKAEAKKHTSPPEGSPSAASQTALFQVLDVSLPK